MKLKEVVLGSGFTLNKILPTLFSIKDKGKIMAIMTSNVDDLLYGYLPGAKVAVQKVLDAFGFGKEEVNSFPILWKRSGTGSE